MTIEIINGNLLDAKEDYIVHQCNCITKYAAHLAYSIFDKFPYADRYAERKQGEIDKPGTIDIREPPDKDNIYMFDIGLTNKKTIINMFGQVYPGKPRGYNNDTDTPLMRENYFNNCLRHLWKFDKMRGGLSGIAFPFGIGCGAAGGRWEKYYTMIETFSRHTNTKIVLYKIKRE